MSRPRIIAVCGLSGVGKTYLIDRFVAAHSHAARLSAGAIIAAARQISDPEFLRKLPANELDRSQELLIAGLPHVLSTMTARLLLFDAHTVIDNGSDELYVVTDAVFASVAPDGIVHVEAEPQVIAQHRAADVQRGRPLRTIQILGDHQQLSARRAQEVAARLNVWVASVRSGDTQTFADVLSRRGAQ